MDLQHRFSQLDFESNTNTQDITVSLNSLSFNHSLSNEEKKYLCLRVRHHAFAVTTCAHAVYIVSTLNEMRQILSEIRHPINQKTIQFLHQSPPRHALKIGLIGCGRLGKQVVMSMLKFTDVKPNELYISTRRPESIGSFQKVGINCFHDNKEVVRTCDVIFLCCLPSQIHAVADDITGHIRPNSLFMSFVTGVPLHRLRQMYQHTNISKTEFTWSMKNANHQWCIGETVNLALEKDWITNTVSPNIGNVKMDGIVWSSTKVIETVLYAAINMCPSLHLTTNEVLQLLNMIFLSKLDSCTSKLTWKHILNDDSLAVVNQGNLPVFDISHVVMHDTPMTMFFKNENEQQLHQMILKKFTSIFAKFKQP
ncbi:NADP-dependent oxidoreductase domain-containing protein 1-like [Ciona intestinalis]